MTLRTRTALFLSMVAALTAAVVAATSWWLVRNDRADSAEQRAVAEARQAVQEAVGELQPGVPGNLELVANRTARRVLSDLVVLESGSVVYASSVRLDVPALDDEVVTGTPGRVISARDQGVLPERTITVSAALDDQPITFVFVTSLADIDADQSDLTQTLAIAAVVLTVFGAAFGAGLGRSLLRPIGAARDTALQVRAGDLDARIDVTSGDEFGQLGDAFNAMVGTVQDNVERLRHLEAEQRRFVGDVSHELRTPLTGLTSASDSLADLYDDDDDGPHATLARLVAGQSERMAELVHDLLEINRVDSGQAELEWSTVTIGETLRAITARHGVDAELAGDATVLTDRRRLEAIIGNLVRNGHLHGEAPVRLEVTSDGARVRVAVSDAGPGIDAADRARVFDRFWKADQSRGVAKGSGLGLAIARSNARLLGGDLTLEGTNTFVLDLPAGSSDLGGSQR